MYARMCATNLSAVVRVVRRGCNAFCTAVTWLTHVFSGQTVSCPPEIPLYACVALVSGCIVGTVDTLAASTEVVSRGFRVQSLVVDTAGGVSVALTRSTWIAITERFSIV